MAWFLCGLVDGEGCFMISITKSAKNKIGWSVKLVFKIGLHKKEQALLVSKKNQIFFFWNLPGQSKVSKRRGPQKC